jgi:putative Ca2+/H+ antiporter (TMEM165/GDT1 family)
VKAPDRHGRFAQFLPRVLLAEIGDRSQLLVILLVLRFPGRERTVLMAAVLAAAISTGMGAAVARSSTIWCRSRTVLMVALSLISAGIGSLMPLKTPKLKVSPRLGAFAASFAALLAAGIGDKTQFLAFTLAARADTPAIAGVGATLAVLVAAVPAALLGRCFVEVVPLRRVRIGIAAVLILVGVGFALDALRLL